MRGAGQVKRLTQSSSQKKGGAARNSVGQRNLFCRFASTCITSRGFPEIHPFHEGILHFRYLVSESQIPPLDPLLIMPLKRARRKAGPLLFCRQSFRPAGKIEARR